jgi:hypothetical protein
MKHPLAEQGKACSAIALSFHQFELGPWPSTIPFLIGQVKPFLTASLSFSIEASKDWSSGSLLLFAWASQASRCSEVACAEHLGKLLDQLIVTRFCRG